MNTFLDTLKSLGPTRLAAMGAVAAGILAFFIYLTSQLASEDMALLFADLSSKDSGQIIAELSQQGVPYTVSQDGSQIRVPSSQVGQLRLQMAEKGLPNDGSVGYEIFDQSSGLGTTNFVQNINRLRALEGELARTIRTIEGVQQARVHLVLPRRQLFTREQQQPSASIVLLMEGSQRLDKEQVLSIQHLVASAVPDMEPNLVSIVDQQGTLLARGGDADSLLGGTVTSQEMEANFEQNLARTLERLIERSVGPGNVRAEVAAEMNFDHVTEKSEIYDPDSQVARSVQEVEETESEVEGGNQENVTVENNLPADQAQQGQGEPGARSQASRTEETTNYEISKTVRTRVSEGGNVERLSVAILVDGRYVTNEAGERVYQERSEEELQQLEALARSAVGFDEARGDQLEVINMRFADPTADLQPAEPTRFLGLRVEQLMRAAELLVLGIVAVLILLLVVRPLVSRILETPATPPSSPEAQLTAEGQPALAGPAGATPPAVAGPELSEFGIEEDEDTEHMIDLNRVEGRVRASSVRKIGEIVDKHPEEAVSIIRTWLYQQQG